MKKKMRLWIEGENDGDFIEYHVSEMFARSVKMLLDANEKATRGSYSRGYDAGYDAGCNDLNLIFKGDE